MITVQVVGVHLSSIEIENIFIDITELFNLTLKNRLSWLYFIVRTYYVTDNVIIIFFP